jgi:hypothetical protein
MATSEGQAHATSLGAGKSTSIVGSDLSGVSGVSQVAAGIHSIAVRLIRSLRTGASTTSREVQLAGHGSGDANVGRASSSRSNEGDRVQRHFMI